MRRYNEEFLLRVTLGYFTVNALYKLLQIICAKYYELRYMFYKKKLHLVKVGAFAWYSVKICIIFGVRFERRKVDEKSKPTRKLKHANFILEYFEYFCQMSSKSILIILSYTVSKFARFLRHSVYKLLTVVHCLYNIRYKAVWQREGRWSWGSTDNVGTSQSAWWISAESRHQGFTRSCHQLVVWFWCLFGLKLNVTNYFIALYYTQI